MKLKEIADICGVSVSTVSRVINNKKGIGEKTRNKILTFISDENSFENNGSVFKTNKVFALVMPYTNSIFFSDIVENIVLSAQSKKIDILLFNTSDDIKKEIEILKYLKTRSIDGIILLSSNKKDIDLELSKIISNISMPLILIDKEIKNINCSGVFFDNIKNVEMLTEYMLKIEKFKTIIITGQKNSDVAEERVIGFKNIYEYNQLEIKEENIIYASFYDKSIVEEKVRKLFENINFDSIICCNNLIARIVIKYILKNGFEVNKDIYVGSFDRLEDMEEIGINVIDLHFDNFMFGESAINILLNKVKRLEYHVNAIKIKSKIVEHK